MAALADLLDLRSHRGSGGPRHVRARTGQRQSAELLEISPRAVRAITAERLSAGETIRICLPGIGSLVAAVTWVGGTEFTAEFCGPSDLRLLFLPKLHTRLRSELERLSS